MIPYPAIDPVMIQIGPLALRWYGAMYALSFGIGWWLVKHRARKLGSAITLEVLSDLLVWIMLGVILGGRLGYVLFYNSAHYLSEPGAMLRVWEGGMSFHGGFLGVVIAGVLFIRKHRLPFFPTAEILVPVFPVGLFLGRIGNFINGELWGRVTDLPWGMVFPGAGPLPRHPSQLYEAALEGAALFALLWWLGRKPQPPGILVGTFIAGYGVCRFVVEFVREPDYHLGLLALNLSMGQWLTVPMLAVGAGFIWHGLSIKRKGLSFQR